MGADGEPTPARLRPARPLHPVPTGPLPWSPSWGTSAHPNCFGMHAQGGRRGEGVGQQVEQGRLPAGFGYEPIAVDEEARLREQVRV